jgi:hypothetical protein
MTLADYAIAIFRRAHRGVLLPSQPGVLDEWEAQEHECHRNTHEWCLRNSGHIRIPGWLYFNWDGLLDHVRFTSHSVVRTNTGELRDITPTKASRPYPFVPADETLEEYEAIVEKHRIKHLDLYLADGRVQVHTLDAPRNAV